MSDRNESSSGGGHNRRATGSPVVVVKKRKFTLKKDKIPEPIAQPSIPPKINNNEVKENSSVLIVEDAQRSIKNADRKIKDLDFGVPKEGKKFNKKKVVDKAKKKEEIFDLDEKFILEEKEVKDKDLSKISPKKDISEIILASYTKEKRSNDSEASSVFLPTKEKYSESKKFNNFFDDEEERIRSIASIKRAREKNKNNRNNSEEKLEKVKEVIIPETITVQELANRMAIRSNEVVKALMKMGMMITATKPIDADTAEIIAVEFGYTVKRVSESDIENILNTSEDNSNLRHRSPVVSVMGHVDHGKTSLLDALRSTDIAAKESGGITQHIGASRVEVKEGKSITFLDTPGHEAFTAMRMRGAKVTDIVILVVAADDGIKEQTIESINHAKAADVPIIIAINKIDKEGADPSRVLNELLEHDIVVESLGGEYLSVEVSAKNKTNLDKLIEMILLQADLLELKANYDTAARGIVVESRVDKTKGIIATLLIQSGTLNIGDIILADTAYGKARLLLDDKANSIKSAFPSLAVEMYGLNNVPESGDKFYVVESEKIARDIVDYRDKQKKDLEAAKRSKKKIEDVFADMADSDTKELSVIVKADVKGSVEAIVSALLSLSDDNVKVKIIHSAVGAISDSDISLANASSALIIGFNVRMNNNVDNKSDVTIKFYNIIYDVINDIKDLMSGLAAPEVKEEYLGKAEIRQVFNLSKSGKIAGCYVLDGVIRRGANSRILRDSIVINESTIKVLKHYKDDIKEANNSSECGISIDKFNDFKEGDIIECFTTS